jgi:hypothetical protein
MVSTLCGVRRCVVISERGASTLSGGIGSVVLVLVLVHGVWEAYWHIGHRLA